MHDKSTLYSISTSSAKMACILDHACNEVQTFNSVKQISASKFTQNIVHSKNPNK
jgi:hypothetical protein